MLLQRQRGAAGGVLCRSAAAGGAAFDNDPYKARGFGVCFKGMCMLFTEWCADSEQMHVCALVARAHG
jgi:hypothetical protein